MHAQSTFFHQGFDLFADLDAYMKKVAAQVGVYCIPCYYMCSAGKGMRTDGEIQSVNSVK